MTRTFKLSNDPQFVEKLVDVVGLYLDHNQLTGAIPTQLGGLINLQNLQLQNNLLTGDVPESLTALVNLALPLKAMTSDGASGSGLNLEWNHLNVPASYPVAGNALHTFLVSHDPTWYLRQSPWIFLPVINK